MLMSMLMLFPWEVAHKAEERILTNLAVQTTQLWDRLVQGFLALAGIYGIVRGVAAEKFTFRSLGWMPGQEKEQIKPKWYHRLFIASVGLLIAISALCSLMGVHWNR